MKETVICVRYLTTSGLKPAYMEWSAQGTGLCGL